MPLLLLTLGAFVFEIIWGLLGIGIRVVAIKTGTVVAVWADIVVDVVIVGAAAVVVVVATDGCDVETRKLAPLKPNRLRNAGFISFVGLLAVTTPVSDTGCVELEKSKEFAEFVGDAEDALDEFEANDELDDVAGCIVSFCSSDLKNIKN